MATHRLRAALSAGVLAIGWSGAAFACDAAGWRIAFEGDSLTYGQDTSPDGPKLPAINGAAQSRSSTPFPEEVAKLLPGAAVENRGFPGDRTTEALERWANVTPSDIAVIMYGTNDAANFGGYPSGPVSVADFQRNLSALVERRQKQGATPILMTPPPVQDPAIDARIQEYRDAVSAVARSTGVKAIDSAALIRDAQPQFSDGLHLSQAANQAVARAMAALLADDYCGNRH